MRARTKFIASLIFTLTIASTSYADKWQTFVFSDDVDIGFKELAEYCSSLDDVTVEDVLWANSVSSSGDIKTGHKVYLPANHADLLAIWQHKGAWDREQNALIPITSAAAAKRAVESKPKPKPTPKPVTPPVELNFREEVKEIKAIEAENKDVQAKLDELTKMLEAPKPASTPDPEPKLKLEPEPEPMPEPKQKIPQETPKPDKILASSKHKQTVQGLADPIIVLSPNGDPTTGPMRLIISGDKVEVVELPKNATPKRPSLADLDNPFASNPDYLMPYYNMTAQPRRNPILNIEKNLNGKMLWPVDGKISSYFGIRGKRKHEGIDIPMPAGTPIRAARNGVVARTGNNSTPGFRGYGNFVLLDHGGGLQTFYAHCLSVAVIPGQRIMQGQVLAYVGNTGRSTGDHLHFEVRVNNVKVNPIPYLAGGAQLAAHK